eukprot:9497708-Pyramimonas_sp.AAC.2
MNKRNLNTKRVNESVVQVARPYCHPLYGHPLARMVTPCAGGGAHGGTAAPRGEDGARQYCYPLYGHLYARIVTPCAGGGAHTPCTVTLTP